jgi:DNA-binding SARP family transcriptional activator/Tfp pilus assembly protein PilF
VEFCVLGPVEVRVTGQPAAAGHPRQRAVLAVLLLDLGRVVPAETLIDRVWGEDPPASVRNVLYGYIGGLRAVLAGAADPQVMLARRPGGYLLHADPGRVDLHQFRHMVREATAAADDERAAGLLREALAQWRGTSLAGVDSPWLNAMRDTLEAERFTAVLDLNDIRLRQGQHPVLVSELAGQAAAHPEDERLIGQLMLALYRSGRQAEALRWFEQTRQRLAGELGTDPGPDLQALHQQILRADPGLQVPGITSLRSVPVPRELPRDVSAFTGRMAGLAELDRLLISPPNQAKAPTAVISAIAGTAGVGKTALAVHWAHQAAGCFPDGQLYVNLRGYDPGQPMSAADALAGFLHSLGVPGQDIPPEAEQRAARYRSLLADKRMLVVLDNAGSADQVRPLLPGTPACATIVTSRDALAGLVARDGAARLDLDVLSLQEAVALLRTLIGARVDDDPGAAAELADQCCRLPLALRVAAELAASRQAVSLAGLAGELADVRTRLDLLAAGGDPRTQVRAIFSWSYRYLDVNAARTFRLLGLHPGPDIEPYAAAALIGGTVQQASQALDALARVHLIQSAGPGRYGMHDLLRGYAGELTNSLDAGQQQHAALIRLFDHYLHTASVAMDILYPAERHHRPRIPRPATSVPPLADPATAREWLDAERANLVAVAAHTAAHDRPGHATRLAATLDSYLRDGGHYLEALTVSGRALGAARRTGDRIAEATALTQIGIVDWQQGRFQQAADRHRQALGLFREAGDRAGEARALTNLGLAETHLGRYEQAARHQQQAVAIYRDIGDRHGEAHTLGNLGFARRLQGRYQEAADYYGQALDLSREIGDRDGEAWTLGRLGVVDLGLGRYQHAAGYLQQALALFQEMGNTGGEAETLVKLGEVYVGLGRYEQAADNFEQAIPALREIGDPVLEADAHSGLGDILFQTGEAGTARAHHATALRLASEAGAPREQARAHSGLARAYHADGDPLQARHHWREALTRYTAIGAPEAEQVRAEMAAR